MNRRKALLTTLLTGALLPARLVAQTARAADDRGAGFRRAKTGTLAARTKDDPGEPLEDEPIPKPHTEDIGMPADFPVEPGQVFRGFDISKYTSLPHEATNPQDSLVEWIFRRTGSGLWHGDRIAVLSAGRAQMRRVSHSEGAQAGRGDRRAVRRGPAERLLEAARPIRGRGRSQVALPRRRAGWSRPRRGRRANKSGRSTSRPRRSCALRCR